MKGTWRSVVGSVFIHVIFLLFSASTPAGVAYDLTGDGRLDSRDIGVLLGRWSLFDTQADLDDDGVIGNADLGRILLQWKPAVPDKASVYRVLNPDIQSGPVGVISLTDNNTIRTDGIVIPLNRYEYQTIPGSVLVPGVAISGDGGFSIGSEVAATDLPAPREFSGTAFVVPQVRGTHYYQIASPYGTAEVNWQTDLDSGSLTVAEGTVATLDAGSTNFSATTIISDIPVLISHSAQEISIQDEFPVPPAATELWGIRSQQAWIGALEDSTGLTLYADDGTQANLTLNSGEVYQVALGSDLDQGQGSAIHIVADKPVGAIQIDDGDGSEASAFFGTPHLGTRYGIPVDAQYLAILCTQADTTVILDDGLSSQTGSCSANGSTPGKLYLGQATSGAYIAAGSILKSSKPVYVMYEVSAQEAEHNLLGADAPWPDAPLLFSDGEIVNQSAYTLTGVADPGVMVDIFVNDLFQVEETADANGLIGADILLQEGGNKIYATAWDGSDESTPSAPITLTYEVIVPDAPVLNAAITPTSDNPYSVTGSAQPGVEIRLYVNGTRQQTTIADAVGQFSFGAYLYDGVNVVHTTAVLGGIESIQSNSLDIEYVNNVSRPQGGTIAQDTVWTPGPVSDPYIIDADLVIANGASLVLMPGTVLQFTGNYKVQVDGALLIQGSETSPVMLSSGKASPAKSDWQGIVVSSSASRVVIDHAVVEYAANGVYFNQPSVVDDGACDTLCVRNSLIENNSTGVYLSASTATIENNTVRNNGNGIYLYNASTASIVGNAISNNSYGIYVYRYASPVISGNEITQNSYGLYVRGIVSSNDYNPHPVVTGNSIYANTSYNYYSYYFYNAASVLLDATGNWWGATDPAAISATIYDYSDNGGSNSPLVDYSGYLDGPGGAPVAGEQLTGLFLTDTALVAGTSYQVLGQLTVPAGVTLTIPAGVELRFAGNYHLVVNGSLAVQGTESEPVVFTSNAAVPAAGDWAGIQVTSSATSVVIDHAVVEYASNGVYFNQPSVVDDGACDTLCVRNSLIENNSTGVYLSASTATIENNTVRNNGNGIYLYNASTASIVGNAISNNSYGIYVYRYASPVISGNEITQNSYGLYVRGIVSSNDYNPHPVVTGNSIYANTSYNYYSYYFYNAASVLLDATGNWWGATDPAAISATIYDYSDNGGSNSPLVDYSGYLDGPGGDPVIILTGTLLSDTELVAGSVYSVEGDLIVPEGVTLTIPGDVVVYFYQNTLQVNGSLVAQGTESNPVVLTSLMQAPSIGDWQGILVNSTVSRIVIDHVDISYADRGIEFAPTSLIGSSLCDTLCVRNGHLENNGIGIYLDGASPWIERNVILNSGVHGIYLTNGSSPDIYHNSILNDGNGTQAGIYVSDASNPSIEANVIVGNGYGIYIVPVSADPSADPAPVITGNAIEGNGIYDLYLDNYFDPQNTIIDATGNWWGTTDELEIAAHIYDYDDAPLGAPMADSSNYLTENPLTSAYPFVYAVSQVENSISPPAGEMLHVAFKMSADGNVTFTVYEEQTRAVVYQSAQLLNAGENSFIWDGRNGSGSYVADGVYVYDIRVDSTGQLLAPSGGGAQGSGSGTIDSAYDPYTNDHWKMYYSSSGGLVQMRVTTSGGQVFFPIDNVFYEPGSHLIVWDGRDPGGNIVTGNVSIYFAAPLSLPTQSVIVHTNPHIVGAGSAPDVEVKSNPYRVMHTYNQTSQIVYRIDQDAYVTVKLLPPGITDLNSAQAIKVVDNVLTSAVTGGVPADHVVDWYGYNPVDRNNILVSDEGPYTFVIQATGQLTGITTTYRGVLQLYQ